MDWNEQRRLDKAADAEQKRKDADAEAERRLKLRAAEDERRRANRQADKAEARAEKQQQRREKRERRRERAQAWAKSTRPGVVYQRGTLALVAASVAAALPAQIMHFAALSLWLVTLPLALEGAAWVMAAGVAYADEKNLPAWVRWLLRGLCLTAAGYAAWINYDYGMQTNPAVGYGLAAVSLLGPLVFEIRQWVMNLSFDASEKKKRAHDKARAKHDKQRRKDHKDVTKLAKRLVSAAPFGSLTFEDAFVAAWEIFYGTATPGMTPALHAQQLASRRSLTEAMDEANGSRISARAVLLQRIHEAPSALISGPGSSQVASDLPPSPERPQKTTQKGGRKAPPPHRRSKGDSVPFSTVAKVEAALERGGTPRRIPAVNGHHH
ncbi:hypothetical protein ACIQW4_01205 [Streptomyces albogriseolus]|uniref:hypothetical protein n=1 Tax=Streptomyces albogriseolus TaxID=1887 RepID=UPI00380AEE69